jgi:hypothetical protein
MSRNDWARVIDDVAELGVGMVQFIGGEPTLHPALPDLLDRALGCGLQVEVFSNLTHISDQLWDSFSQPGVSLATSYFSDIAGEHEAITTQRGSHARTKANIAEALRRGIPLRAGVIDLGGGQRARQGQSSSSNWASRRSAMTGCGRSAGASATSRPASHSSAGAAATASWPSPLMDSSGPACSPAG